MREAFASSPTKSIHTAASQLPHSTLHKVLHRYLRLNTYKVQFRQVLEQGHSKQVNNVQGPQRSRGPPNQNDTIALDPLTSPCPWVPNGLAMLVHLNQMINQDKKSLQLTYWNEFLRIQTSSPKFVLVMRTLYTVSINSISHDGCDGGCLPYLIL